MTDPFEVTLNRANARIGKTLRDKWRLQTLLGVGGMAAVYSAIHTNNGKRVALKVLEPVEGGDAAGAVESSLREARAAAAIAHPNATAVCDADQIDGSAFLVMEFVPGTSLREIVGDPAVPLATRILLDRGACFSEEARAAWRSAQRTPVGLLPRV